VDRGVASAPAVLAINRGHDSEAVAQLAKGTRSAAERGARAAPARRPLTAAPTTGTVTSGFGARWGTTHDGVDIANAIGTPVLAVTDGVVLQSGPASGFGLWVRVRQDDGTIGIYGHINEFFVAAGQRVSAGYEIATVGNRGVSTGPHLHYGVQDRSGSMIDPLAWLDGRGLSIP
jgi:murein DD-endopeptidase MepM/ murein hydrolase activator NlpD